MRWLQSQYDQRLFHRLLYIYQSDITVDLENNVITVHKKITENWNVTVVDTGLSSSTGQRVSRIKNYIEEEDFIVTYGDCLSNIDITKLIDAYCSEQKLAMVALARPAGRNRILPLDEVGNIIIDNRNPHMGADAWTNANTFVLNRRVFDFLQGNYSLEDELIHKLSERGEITTYKHEGFWRAVETNRDKSDMEGLWNAGMTPWKVTLVDTGLSTLTAGRILKAKEYIGEEPFMLTYGDGVSNVDINKLLAFHQQSGRIATITTTRPEGRFGAIKIEKMTGRVESFKEKARKDQAWVNAGFMVMQPEVFEYLGDGSEMLEATPFELLARDGQMGPIVMKVSGHPWIRCVTKYTWKECGKQARHHGK